jgi:hypothetical protein
LLRKQHPSGRSHKMDGHRPALAGYRIPLIGHLTTAQPRLPGGLCLDRGIARYWGVRCILPTSARAHHVSAASDAAKAAHQRREASCRPSVPTRRAQASARADVSAPSAQPASCWSLRSSTSKLMGTRHDDARRRLRVSGSDGPGAEDGVEVDFAFHPGRAH